uniref:Uncharacterized protein n=1 Tax=Arundo donax TaxID=35708 RepID=A0A0A8YBJ6_ARUDO
MQLKIRRDQCKAPELFQEISCSSSLACGM